MTRPGDGGDDHPGTAYPESVTSEQPRSAAEALVEDRLRADLPPEAYLLPNIRITHHGQECEIDLFVIWPGVGTAVLEVKGGQVSLDRGRWMQSDRDGAHEMRNPVAQAQRAKHILLDYFEDRLPSFGGIGRTVHLAVLPYTTLPADFSAPDAPRELVIDSTGMAAIPGRIADALRRQGGDHGAVTRTGADIAVKNLLATHTAIRNQQDRARELEDEGNQLTAEQHRVLELLSYQRLAQITGGAGSGKTHLAMLKARGLARAGYRTALLCYSRGLARDFELQSRTWPEAERPAYVGMFHELAHWWGSDTHEPEGGRDAISHYYEEVLPRHLVEVAGALPQEQRFDAVVVDEAQDFSDVWWEALNASVTDPDEALLWVFTDQHQRVFDREGDAPITLSPFPLFDNLRNTPEIAGTFGSLSPVRQRTRLGSGAPVRFVDVDPEDVLDRADDAVLALAEEGWKDGQIALLTTGSRHPLQVEAVEYNGWDAYWDGFFAGEDVFYGHVRGFKGLERSVVVLAVNSRAGWDRAAEMLYVGMSRARSLLVVVGPREEIEAIGGSDVMDALDAAQAWRPPEG